MPIIHSRNIPNNQNFIRDSTGYCVSSNLTMPSNIIMSKEALLYSFNSVGSEGFMGKSEIVLDTEFVKKDGSLVQRLSIIREGLLRVLNIEVPLFSAEEMKELEDMISSLDKSIVLCEGAFGSEGFLGGDEPKNGGLSSITPVGYIPESPSYLPFEKDSGIEYWDLKWDACKAAIEYQQKFCPISSPNRNYEQDGVSSPDYVSEGLPSPTYASPFENWSSDYVSSDVLSRIITPGSQDYVSGGTSPKRKAVDDWDLESHAPKVKKPRMS